MRKRKAFLSMLLAATMIISPIFTNVAYAAEASDLSIEIEENKEEVSIAEQTNSSVQDSSQEEVSKQVDEQEQDDTQEQVDEPEQDDTQEQTDSPVVVAVQQPSNELETVGGGISEVGENGAAGIGGVVPCYEGANVSGTYKEVNPDNLSVILRGVSENTVEESFELINQYLAAVINEGKRVTITNSDFVDAEKYNTQIQEYDMNHCWAATAANILWTTGYAKKAVNPMTDDYFESEDEILAYFSENFTDYAGRPVDAVNWFFYGPDKYALTDVPNTAQLKNNSTGGLLPNLTGAHEFMGCLLDNSHLMDIIYEVASYGMGVLVRWLVQNEDGTYGLSKGAHWATVTGVVSDESVSDESDSTKSIYDSVKAIIIADSDNEPVDGDLPALTEAKLAAKSEQPNSYTIYKVSYDKGLGMWLINNFYNGYGVITHLYGLLDSDKEPGGAGGEFSAYLDALNAPLNDKIVHIPKEVQKIIDDLNSLGTPNDETEIAIFVENSIMKDVTLFTEEDLNNPTNSALLREYMIKNHIQVYRLNKGVIEEGKDCIVYVTAEHTEMFNLMIDGIIIPEESYSITATNNGLTKLVIKNEYLANLSKGIHTAQFEVKDSEMPIVFEIDIQ